MQQGSRGDSRRRILRRHCILRGRRDGVVVLSPAGEDGVDDIWRVAFGRRTGHLASGNGVSLSRLRTSAPLVAGWGGRLPVVLHGDWIAIACGKRRRSPIQPA